MFLLRCKGCFNHLTLYLYSICFLPYTFLVRVFITNKYVYSSLGRKGNLNSHLTSV